MSKPDDIPQDVLKKARGCIEVREFNAEIPKNTIARIARAIMAEREQCAKIAAWFADSNSEFLPEEVVIACGQIATDISQAIRNGGK